MLFPTITKPQNKTEIIQVIRNRDNDEVCSFVCGTGYALFRGRSQDVLSAEPIDRDSYDYKGLIVNYTVTASEAFVFDGVVYPTHDQPMIGDVCVWRDIQYTITGVRSLINIHGDVEAYEVFIRNG